MFLGRLAEKVPDIQASKLNPKAALPLLGLAQMSLVAKEYTNAITLLEKALQLHPGWNDALMVSHVSAALRRPAPLLSGWMADLSRKTPHRM